MPDYLIHRPLGRFLFLAAVAPAFLYGLAWWNDSSESPHSGANHLIVNRTTTPTAHDEATVAFIDGQPVAMSALMPRLLELAGVEALGELIIDRRLRATCAEREIVIDQTDIDRERQLLGASLSDDPDEAVLLLKTIRERQGLGEVRFAELLQRNAMLRALVADDVSVSETAARQTFELTYGEKRTARIIVMNRLSDAEEVRRLIDAGSPFIDLAVRRSNDASAVRGGLLPPVSRADASWPSPFRESLWQLTPGEVSAPVLLDGQFVLIQLIETVPGSGLSFEDVQIEMNELTRRSRERVLMEELAQRLLEESRVSVVDDSLRRAWNNRRP